MQTKLLRLFLAVTAAVLLRPAAYAQTTASTYQGKLGHSAVPVANTLSLTPPTPGLVLQSTDSLSPTNWVNAPSGTNNPATVPASLPARFYRLFKP
jgi:hypothetical protein